MPDSQLLLLASDLRVRAEEILAKVETMGDADAREMMREKLALQVELRADEA
jgi:hypothetical protein